MEADFERGKKKGVRKWKKHFLGNVSVESK